MPLSSEPLRRLGFLTIGLFEEADPRRGHESTLEIIELGEQLGFDSVWVRHRHLQFGISSPVAILAAASQRTRRIQLGTAVIPLGWENPLRLAEDLATVDALSGGRLNPGVSVGPPMHYDQVKYALCCSRLISSGPPCRSLNNSGLTRRSSRLTRWRLPFPSPSTTGIMCRSSPISPQSSARLSAGCQLTPRGYHEPFGKYLLRGSVAVVGTR